jgi:hypothetical protein
MPKKDAEKLAGEVWAAKDEFEATTGHRVGLGVSDIGRAHSCL